jgi:hypothetical protein
LGLVAHFGKPVVQVSLHTKDKREAIKRRALEDIKCDALFDAAIRLTNENIGTAPVKRFRTKLIWPFETCPSLHPVTT